MSIDCIDILFYRLFYRMSIDWIDILFYRMSIDCIDNWFYEFFARHAAPEEENIVLETLGNERS